MRVPLLIYAALVASAFPQDLQITEAVTTNGQIRLTWESGLPPFMVHERTSLDTNTTSMTSGPVSNRSAVVSITNVRGYFQVEALGEPSPQNANYRITFNNEWTAQNHPTDFPSGAHYSLFVIAAHHAGINFWRPGRTATTGIKNMAESGSNSALFSEIDGAITTGAALRRTFFSESSPTTTIELSQDHPLITLCSMIAPSPDWFVGVHDLALFDAGQWIEDLTLDVYPYDAGTDNGTTYRSPNAATTPPVNIFRITGAPFLNGVELRRLGTFRFQRITP